VYDITKRKTFETLQQWISELRAQGPENIVLAIAGNKSDLEDERQVCACG
jgi:GTPase SAR1 family protein